MKGFDTRWQKAAAQARAAAGRDDRAPFGFSTRLAARVVALPTQPTDLAWDRLALRALIGAVSVLVLCWGLEGPHWRNSRSLEPSIENTVAQLVWSL